MKTMLFIDYWNLLLTLQNEDGKERDLSPAALQKHRFNVDWFGLGPKLVKLASIQASPDSEPLHLEFQEMRIYTSCNPNTEQGQRYKTWAYNNLARQAGVRVFCQDRKPKHGLNCPECHRKMDVCPHCGTGIDATQEKGVDTLLVTDLLRLGLENTYDVALLVSQDSDMAPAAEHLGSKGIKVIQVGIKHFGKGLAAKCWADFDLYRIRDEIKREGQ